MKVCPVCTESFGDEFSFCDIDGTKLKRDASSPPAQNKVWSLLGVGLLIGAVVISAAAIIFLPKAPVSPVARSSESQTNAAPAKTNSDETPASATAFNQDEANANVSAVVAKKQDKAQELTNANVSEATGTDVKSVAQPAEPGVASPQPETTALTPPPPPPRTEAPIIETRAPEPSPKSIESSAERKESKSSAKSSKDSDDKKKDDDKGKKKGGGFFKVFKKIFGKD